MLLEFDADQRLWQETVRDAVAKQCPPSLVRSIAEDGVDPTPLWKTYIDAGWTELTDPENAVELAIGDKRLIGEVVDRVVVAHFVLASRSRRTYVLARNAEHLLSMRVESRSR
jgi:hypothetical protein